MMEEETGYNPFFEGGGGEEEKERETKREENNRHSFLEGDYGKRYSFIENNNPPSPSTSSSSPSISSRHSPSLSSSSLRVSLPSSEAIEQSLENPFVNDTIPLDDPSPFAPSPPPPPSSSSSSSSPSSSLLSIPTSPLKSPTERRLSISSAPRIPGSPRLPSSPLASSSSGISPPRSDESLFTYKSPPTPRSVVTLEKAEWVPDEYSLVCEHCGDEFTLIRRRHHCRVCGHLFCNECIVTMTLPATLGYAAPQKSCVLCAYNAIRMRGNFSSTIKESGGLAFSQRWAGRMQNFYYRMAGMSDEGKFDRFASTITAPRNFSAFQTESVLSSSTKFEMRKVVRLRIPTDDGTKLDAHAYIPKGNGPFSILIYIPGGAFVLETEPSIAPFCKELSCKIGCIVVSITYRLSPENKFPTAWEDCYSAVKWIYESSALDLTRLEKDPKIVVCGEGSGGLLAAAVCQMARDRGTPPIRYQLLVTPWLNISTINLGKFYESYVLPKDMMEWVLNQIFRYPSDRDGAYASPLLTSSLENLPPAKIITAGHDPLMNDAEEYANELRKHGVAVSVTRYENSLHDFVGNYADAASELEEAVYECVVCVREVFGCGEPVATKNRPVDTKKRSENLSL